MRTQRLLAFLTLAALLGGLLAGCAIEPETETAALPTSTPAAHHSHAMAPAADMPPEVLAATERTQEAYRFAYANPAAAAEVPCYCGCVALGHITSYDCYVSGLEDDRPVLEPHALNCTVCVDITQDQMRLMDGGADVATIRRELAASYSIYGPPTPLVAGDEDVGEPAGE
jgi:hypothetical protein